MAERESLLWQLSHDEIGKEEVKELQAHPQYPEDLNTGTPPPSSPPKKYPSGMASSDRRVVSDPLYIYSGLGT